MRGHFSQGHCCPVSFSKKLKSVGYRLPLARFFGNGKNRFCKEGEVGSCVSTFCYSYDILLHRRRRAVIWQGRGRRRGQEEGEDKNT